MVRSQIKRRIRDERRGKKKLSRNHITKTNSNWQVGKLDLIKYTAYLKANKYDDRRRPTTTHLPRPDKLRTRRTLHRNKCFTITKEQKRTFLYIPGIYVRTFQVFVHGKNKIKNVTSFSSRIGNDSENIKRFICGLAKSGWDGRWVCGCAGGFSHSPSVPLALFGCWHNNELSMKSANRMRVNVQARLVVPYRV